MRRAPTLAVLLAACGPSVPVDDGGTTGGVVTTDPDDDDSNADGPATTQPGTTMPGTATSPSTTEPTTVATTIADDGSSSSSGENNDDRNSISFIDTLDYGTVVIECDVWANDCQRGEKCMPWANDGGNSWNATRCTPIDRTPAMPNDPCIAEGSGFSGIDDCAAWSMCWGVADDGVDGHCYSQCQGSEAIPICPDDRICFVGYLGVLTLCVAQCDPLAPVCAAHESCVFDATSDLARCIPTELVTGTAYAEPCDTAVFECGSGLHCAHPDHVPSCGELCCTAMCDLAAPIVCPDAASGQTCLPLYRDAPPGLENLGFCGAPA